METTLNNLSNLHEVLSSYADILRLFDLSPAHPQQIQKRLSVAGMINCFPLLKYNEAAYVVLRSGPELKIPTVAIADVLAGESVQVASNINSLTPVLFVLSLVMSTSKRWISLRDGDEASIDRLLSMDKVLGGCSTKESYAKLLDNQEIMNAFCKDIDVDGWQMLLPSAIECLVPEESRIAFQRKLQNITGEMDTDYYRLEDGNCWKDPYSVALAIRGKARQTELFLELKKRALHCAVNQDGEWVHLEGVCLELKSAAHKYGVHLVSAPLVIARTDGELDDPYKDAIIAMAEQGDEYDGRAHLNQIDKLVNDGLYELAWNSALTTGFWMYKRHGSVPVDLMLLQGKLAREHFSETLWPIVKMNLISMGFTASELEI